MTTSSCFIISDYLASVFICIWGIIYNIHQYSNHNVVSRGLRQDLRAIMTIVGSHSLGFVWEITNCSVAVALISHKITSMRVRSQPHSRDVAPPVYNFVSRLINLVMYGLNISSVVFCFSATVMCRRPSATSNIFDGFVGDMCTMYVTYISRWPLWFAKKIAAAKHASTFSIFIEFTP